jgi:hypothetical protein
MHRSRRWRNGDYGSPAPTARATVAERLAAMSVRVGDCLVWVGSINNNGYGRLIVSVDGCRATSYAHRASYEQHVGPIPEGAEILHSCDNPPCIEPTHLRVGTQKQNAADMVARERNPRYLPLTVVAELHRRFQRGEPDLVVARALGLPRGTVSARRSRWRRLIR